MSIIYWCHRFKISIMLLFWLKKEHGCRNFILKLNKLLLLISC